MKCAYLILAHKDPQQLARLLSMICVEGNSIYLHIDSKSDIASFREQLAPYKSFITLTPNRISVNWGGFSIIKATLALIHTYHSSGEKADYVHLISGQDLPLLPDPEIKKFFELNSSSNFIEWHPIPYKGWINGGKDRLCYKWLMDEENQEKVDLLIDFQRRFHILFDLPSDITPFGGSQWWSLTHSCVEYLSKRCTPSDSLYQFFKYTFVPDELYFHTILLNSDWKKSITNNNYRFIDWDTGPKHPLVLTESDRPRWEASGKLWGRKFESNTRIIE